MDIKSKFIYAITKEAFQRELPNIPINLDPIVFIEDTKELWTHGTYFSLGYPSINISEILGAVQVDIGDQNILVQTTGASLSIRKGVGNSIIINSNALNSIDTEAPLEWKADSKKLFHKKSTVVAGSYGQSGDLTNASTFYIPKIIVDEYGHITTINNSGVSIRDFVVQEAPSLLNVTRNILLSYNAVDINSDTAQVRKANGLTYNDFTGDLGVKGGITVENGATVNNGDLTVVNGYIIGNLKGDVTGEATPKIHLSDKPEYGGASQYLYRHVKLQDDLTEEPPASSDNQDVGSAVIINGVAASPKMVWDTKQQLLIAINNKPNIGGFIVNGTAVEITKPNQIITIAGENGVAVNATSDGFIITGIEITGYDEANVDKIIENNIKFSKDFSFSVTNEMSIRWEEVQ